MVPAPVRMSALHGATPYGHEFHPLRADEPAPDDGAHGVITSRRRSTFTPRPTSRSAGPVCPLGAQSSSVGLRRNLLIPGQIAIQPPAGRTPSSPHHRAPRARPAQSAPTFQAHAAADDPLDESPCATVAVALRGTRRGSTSQNMRTPPF